MGTGGRSSSGGAGGGAINRPIEQPRSRVVDTSDLSGTMLRSVLLDLHEIQTQEASGLKTELEDVKKMTRSAMDEANELSNDIDAFLSIKTIMNSEDYGVQSGTPEAEDLGLKERVENERKFRELDKRRKEKIEEAKIHADKEMSLYKKVEEKDKEHKNQINSIFFVGKQNQINLEVDITKGTELYRYKDKIQEQADFIEKLWVPYDDTYKKIKIHAKGEHGGGGSQIPGTINVKIGLDRVYDTTPMHEFAHSIEDQMKAEPARAEKAKSVILKRTKKKNIEEVEVKQQVSYVDHRGKEHYAYDTKNKQPIYVPVGIFKDVNEESRSGYMFRVYEHDVEERNGKKYIRSRPSTYLGIEMPSVGVERIYGNPVRFAKEYPDVFDIVVDTFRKK